MSTADPAVSPAAPAALPTPAAPVGMSISETERRTGISRETLRIWERRYGFPAPARNAAGDRLYPPDQVQRLRLLRRLIDAGHRPGQVVGAGHAESVASAPASELRSEAQPADPAHAPFIAQLRGNDLRGLRHTLERELLKRGLGGFLQTLLAPLIGSVGAAWAAGELAIYEEHLFAEMVDNLLVQAIQRVPEPPFLQGARVLLATVPGEAHGLGLRMAQALLVLEGAQVLSLGLQTPVADIAAAARRCQSHIVALSFSPSAPDRLVSASVRSLRRQLDATTAIWVGGSAPALASLAEPGVRVLGSLGDIAPALQAWNAKRTAV